VTKVTVDASPDHRSRYRLSRTIPIGASLKIDNRTSKIRRVYPSDAIVRSVQESECLARPDRPLRLEASIVGYVDRPRSGQNFCLNEHAV
jgi:hypothetical protein